MIKNFSVIVSISIFLIGIVAGYGRLQAKTEDTAKKVEKVEERIEEIEEEGDKKLNELKKESDQTQKVIVEQTVKLEYMQKILEKIDKKLEKEN